MHIDDWLNDPRSRRRLFQQAGVAFVGGSAVFLAACGSDNSNGSSAGGGVGAGGEGGSPDDADILNSALGLEQMAIAAYGASLGVLTGPARDLATTFKRQEQEHADGLVAAIKKLGGKPVTAKDDYGFPDLPDAKAVANFALEIENSAVSAYIDAIPQFSAPELRATAAAIVTNEAEHIALLHPFVGKQPFPLAFVTGKGDEEGVGATGTSGASGGSGLMSREHRLHVVDGDVDTAVVAEYEATRRDAMRRGLGFGGTALAAASIPLLLGVRNAFAQASGDAAILESAIKLEQIAVLAYTTATKSKVLTGAGFTAARMILAQEQEHADGLSAALRQLGGGSPPSAPTNPSAVDAVLPGLSDAKSAADVANFAIELETMALAAYYDAHLKLKAAALLQTGAAIMANEGQHLTVLRQLVNQDPVPNAFETGKATA